jgi:hemerythrin-like domain-containing protein
MDSSRRGWLAAALGTGAVSALAIGAASALAGPQDKPRAQGEKEQGASRPIGDANVWPDEDLMREHGVLNRILLVYDEAIRRIRAREEVPLEQVRSAAGIIRTFVEGYHEKLEEEHLFPRFEKAGKLTDLVAVLRTQHEAGRRVTSAILDVASREASATDATALADRLGQFVRMYRPHEAREDTVLFPAFRDIVTRQEFERLGEEFEGREDKVLGEHGFERVVEEVAGIERALGIYELSNFTPRV